MTKIVPFVTKTARFYLVYIFGYNGSVEEKESVL